jgi:hypothetical protein
MRCQKCEMTNSSTARFCKQCGTLMPRQAQAAAVTQAVKDDMAFAMDTSVVADRAPATTGAAVATAAAASFTAAANITAADAVDACPQCGTQRVGGKRFCRSCRFDFSALEAASVQNVPAAEEMTKWIDSQAGAKAAEQAEEERRRVAEAQAVAQCEAEASAAAQTEEEHRVVDGEPCPTCSTPRTNGKRFCRTCRYDFVACVAHQASPAVVSNEITGASPSALEGEAEEHDERESTASRVDERATGQSTTSAMPPASEPVRHNATAASQAQTATNPTKIEPDNGNRKKIIMIGSAAVVFLGIAISAGVLLRAHRTSTADGQQTQVGAPTATTAPRATAADAPSAPTAAGTQQSSTSQPEPQLAPAASQAAAARPDVQQPTSAPAVENESGARTTPATSTKQANEPVEPAATVNPPAAAALSEPTLSAQQREAAPAQPSHPKPRKPTAPAPDAAAQNPTIRAAIAGSLADGTSCFGNKKYDCAISNADAVLRLDPHNSLALSLRRRAKAAQDAALNSLSIQ